jgi:hypothetical protein
MCPNSLQPEAGHSLKSEHAFMSLKGFFLSLTFIAVVVLGATSNGQTAPAVRVGGADVTGIPQDWSTRHVIFSNPGTEQEAIQRGWHDQWRKVVNDPRYVIQQLRRNLPVQGPAAVDASYRARWIAEAAGAARSGSANPDNLPSSDRGYAGRFGRPVEIRKLHVKPSPKIKKDWNESLGSATSSTAINSPAKWSFDSTSESCTGDFVVYPTGQAGSATQATILAYYNLYSECGGTVPTVDWQYNTGAGSSISLAPEFSLDGTQVALIQSNGTTASLVLLKFKLIASGSGALATLTSQSSAANYLTCTAPCMYSMTLSGSPNDTWSNPYYDYGTDTLFVGDSTGRLHKFNPVFKAAPAEVTTSPWPVQMANTASDTNQLASPIYDETSGYVFVGSTTSPGTTAGGYFYAVNASTGAIHGYSAQLDSLYGVREAPLVDQSAESVYVFASHNTGGNSAVYQFPATFTSSTTPVSVSLGSGSTSDDAYMFAGAFDNTYFTSSSSASPTGYLYACPTSAPAVLYQIPITNGVMSTTATTGPTMGSTSYWARCSPITEFYNANAVETAATSAVGTATIFTDPSTWSAGQTITIGATTYTFVSTLSAVNQVLLVTNATATRDETRTAKNLEAVVNANAAECYGGSGCLFAGQTANASVTANQAAHVVTLTSLLSGVLGDFTLNSSNGGDVEVSGGSNGSNQVTGVDYLFLSVFASTETGCTSATADGCVMSFDVTTPSSFGTGTTPLGTLNISSPNLTVTSATNPSASTSGIVIDNNGAAAGQSQIYFLTQYNSSSTACVSGGADGICAIQASQSGP